MTILINKHIGIKGIVDLKRETLLFIPFQEPCKKIQIIIPLKSLIQNPDDLKCSE